MAGDRARREQVLDGLDPEQRAAVLAPPGPVRILAGAGTGKTRTITRRIAYLAGTGQVKSSEILAVTHSNQAAGELRDRIRSLGVSVQARTFHSAAMGQLRHFWARTGLPGDELRMIREVRGGQGAFLRKALEAEVRSVATTDVRDFGEEIDWARRSRLTPDQYARAANESGRKRNLPASVLAAAFKRYEQAKRSQAVLDFGDLIEQCALLLERDDEVAAQFRERYRCFVVDEYQDTDPAQERLLSAWLGPGRNVTVVGDPHQTIFSFKGADPSLLVGFTDRFPGAVSISLDRDYRSTPQIVAYANRIMGPASAGVVLKGQRPDGPEPIRRTFDTEATEAAALAERVNELVAEGVAASEIAILVRTRSQILFYRAALQDAGVITEVFDDEKFFERQEIRQAMTALGDLADRSPAVTGLDGLRAVLENLGFDPAVPPAGQGAARDRWESLGALLRLVERVPDDVRETVGILLRELERRAAAEHAPRRGGVTLATMHKAKGLEWDAVLLPGLAEGYLPIAYATSSEEIDEERRLFYVAVTRARERLELSHALANEKGYPRNPSRFLDQIVPIRRPVAAAPAPPPNPYSVGDRVVSTAFGMGKVIATTKTAVTADFGTPYGVKTVPADHKLSKL
ncbi:ATP-dependent helicase [Amycolatopsis sp. GA6-003]|uniref:ATP-dependent helicase n=1 Tax=Amycolatopsis sp. GA6-003 TaxID=2652444 RepID=UPI0039172749